jgi:hypothetical protein
MGKADLALRASLIQGSARGAPGIPETRFDVALVGDESVIIDEAKRSRRGGPGSLASFTLPERVDMAEIGRLVRPPVA